MTVRSGEEEDGGAAGEGDDDGVGNDESATRATAMIKLGVEKMTIVMMTKIMRALERTNVKMMVESPALSTGFATPSTAMKKNKLIFRMVSMVRPL